MTVPINSTNNETGFPAWIREPFLHVDKHLIYNPMTDRTLQPGDEGFSAISDIHAGRMSVENLPENLRNSLIQKAWLIADKGDLSKRFYLKYVEIEASTTCNQACSFCPVSVNPRPAYKMPLDFYENIVSQLADYRHTMEGVLMLRYNEPTADSRFLDQVRILKAHDIPIGLNSNATGLIPRRVDELLKHGGLRFLSVNLSTMDRGRYRKERSRDHLKLVMRNMDYIKDRPLAERMDLAVLGSGDDTHKKDFEAIQQHFSGSHFDVQYHEIMDRAGYMDTGHRPSGLHTNLAGCEQTGSRPLQWLTVTPQGLCVLCCEDYDEDYVVGDLNQQTIAEVLTGPRISKLRRWAYGLEEAPADFICRKCTFARNGCDNK